MTRRPAWVCSWTFPQWLLLLFPPSLPRPTHPPWTEKIIFNLFSRIDNDVYLYWQASGKSRVFERSFCVRDICKRRADSGTRSRVLDAHFMRVYRAPLSFLIFAPFWNFFNFQNFALFYNFLPNFQNLLHFQNGDLFSNCWPISKMFAHFQNTCWNSSRFIKALDHIATKWTSV